MITCPRCGFQAPDGTPYCPRCGYGRPVPPVPPVPQNQIPSGSAPDHMLTCPKCGLKLPPGSRFCSRCGYQFQTDQPAEKYGLSLTGRILVAIAIAVCVLGVGSVSLLFYLTEKYVQTTPTMSARAIQAAAHETTEALRQKTEEPKLTKTAEYLLTPTRTPEPTLPPLCNDIDRQMDIIKIADVLDAKGHPHPEKYNPESNSCIYRISDSESFLGINSFGFLTISYTENNNPDIAVVEMFYKDNAETIENITDWGAVALAYIDDSQNPLTASATIRTIQNTGFGETSNCSIVSRLDTDDMIYKYTIIKGTGIFDTLQEIFDSE